MHQPDGRPAEGSREVLEVTGNGSQSLLQAKTPKAGLHLLTLDVGKAVEIVIQSDRAGAFGGEYNSSAPITSNRNGREQRPFHLHGYHFWVVGMGLGAWSPENATAYNLKDPALRDKATVLFQDAGEAAGWVALRFVTGNAGVWPLHCHITPHMMMGQALNVVVAPDKIPAPPKGMPQCPKKCNYQMASWTLPLTDKLYKGNPNLAPLNANGGP